MSTSLTTSSISKVSEGWTYSLSKLEPLSYAMLRVVLAIVLVTHGLPKMLGTSHGTMANPMGVTIQLIEKIGLPFAPQLAFLVMLLETGGAVLLALGLLTRPVALLVVFEMAAISVALGPTWAWINRGIEYPVLMGFLALYMVTRGGGQFSIDNYWLSSKRGSAIPR